MTGLPEGWEESAERIAWHCARTHRAETPLLTLDARYEAALDGLVEYTEAHGWPADLKPVFRAAANAIGRAGDEAVRHITFWSYWYPAPGTLDSLAENVTDMLGVRQLVWVLPDHEWEAIWALAEQMKRGGDWRDAARMIGVSDTCMKARLARARARCRAEWAAPGETVRPYHPSRRGARSRYRTWAINSAAYYARKAAA
jgi:hypothetical protein